MWMSDWSIHLSIYFIPIVSLWHTLTCLLSWKTDKIFYLTRIKWHRKQMAVGDLIQSLVFLWLVRQSNTKKRIEMIFYYNSLVVISILWIAVNNALFIETQTHIRVTWVTKASNLFKDTAKKKRLRHVRRESMALTTSMHQLSWKWEREELSGTVKWLSLRR